MRRWLSIFLVLLFGLWPLTGTLEASDDSRLPPCCRRHGAHHCAITMTMARASSGTTPMLAAPATCPQFPGFVRGTSTPSHALTACAVGLPGLPMQARTAMVRNDEARLRPLRTHAGRGPPASSLS